MNILFLTLLDFNSIKEHNIYTDLLREFVRHNHSVYIISPIERRTGRKTEIITEDNTTILKLKIGNIQKTNLIEKGISTVLLETLFISGIKKYFDDVKFDLVLYSTPPITFQKAVTYVKKRDNAKTYLMLKDIFPQNAVDMGMLSKSGVKSMLYKYFRAKEKKLYSVSDYIGCMSKANVEYIIEHNPEIDAKKVGICPNSIEVIDKSVTKEERIQVRKKYGIPLDKKVFVYGGNLGKPQGIDFLIECLKSQEENEDVYFLIVGDGTEFPKINRYVNERQPSNVCLMKRLPKEDYDLMVGACDVGMIFLDHRFTIPNFPSRILSYMQASLPILAITDPNTDVGKVIVEGEFGWWCESSSIIGFAKNIEKISKYSDEEYIRRAENAWSYLQKEYKTKECYEKIMLSLVDCCVIR